MPRDISLSDSKCWKGGQKWVKCGLPAAAKNARNEIKSGRKSLTWCWNAEICRDISKYFSQPWDVYSLKKISFYCSKVWRYVVLKHGDKFKGSRKVH